MFRSAILSAAPRRLFSTAPTVRNAAGAAPAVGGFGDLGNILSTASPSGAFPSSSSSSQPAPLAPVVPQPERGFPLDAMPVTVDPVLELFTNALMKSGKKGEAQKHVTNILTLLQRATNKPPIPLLHQAVVASAPSVKIFSMRKGAKNILTPRALTERARTTTGIRWLLKAAERGRKGGVKRDDRIAREILAVLDGSSEVLKRIEEVHRSGMINRANLYTR